MKSRTGIIKVTLNNEILRDTRDYRYKKKRQFNSSNYLIEVENTAAYNGCSRYQQL